MPSSCPQSVWTPERWIECAASGAPARAGDVAITADDPLPQLAQPAIQGGRHAGAQIRRLLAGSPTEPFRYKNKGTMATIGRSDAVVELPQGIRLTGLVAWLAWLGLHLVALMGNRNRLATLANGSRLRPTHHQQRLNHLVKLITQD